MLSIFFLKITAEALLNWAYLFLVDTAIEFMGAFAKVMASHKTIVHRGRSNIQHYQGIVERFNKALSKRLFG